MFDINKHIIKRELKVIAITLPFIIVANIVAYKLVKGYSSIHSIILSALLFFTVSIFIKQSENK